MAPRDPVAPGRFFAAGAWGLFRREMLRFRRDLLEEIGGRVLTLLLYFAVFALAMGTSPTAGTNTGGTTYLDFLAPGLVAFAVLQRASEAGPFTIIIDKYLHISPDVLMPPLGAAELTLAYTLSAAVTGLVAGLASAIALYPFWPHVPAAPGALLLFASLGAVLMALVGIVLALWADKWDQVAAVSAFLLLPLTFFSGVFVPFEALPEAARTFVLASPIFHAVSGMRFGYLGAAPIDPAVSASALAAGICVSGIAVFLLFRSGYGLRR